MVEPRAMGDAGHTRAITLAVVAAALGVLVTSAARIGLAIVSGDAPLGVDDFDVRLDGEGGYRDLDDEPILPANRRKSASSRGEGGPGAVRDVLPALYEMSKRARKLDDATLPHRCGVILYHRDVPGEGGEALDEWAKGLAESNGGRKASFLSSEDHESKEAFEGEVERRIERLESMSWTIVRSRGSNGLAFASDEDTLHAWRKAAEDQDCRLVAAAVFSDPLDHGIQRAKEAFSECNCTMADFEEEMIDGIANDPGQLDRFLFGRAEPSEENEGKVKRGMHLLQTLFDIVMIYGEGDFAKEISRVMGWTASNGVREASVSDGDLVYSKEAVSKFGKLAAAKGDADFLDAVNHVYHNSLQFLMLQ
ncbi:hypothetical protein ACHAWF_001268 [Thalassiosira exigua]